MNLIGLSGLVQRAKFLVNDNLPAILTGVGITGTVTTAVLTGRASFKAARIIDEESRKIRLHEELDNGTVTAEPELSSVGKAKLVWHLYLPPVAVGATTVASIVMANRVSSSKIAALTVASALSERRFQEYREKVVEKLGDRQATAIRAETAQDRIDKNPPRLVVTDDSKVLCMDAMTGRYFQSTMEDLKRAENKINHEVNNFMSASLSEFYDELGLPPTNYTDAVGWNANTRLEIQVDTGITPDQKPCLVVDFAPPPFPEYTKVYD